MKITETGRDVLRMLIVFRRKIGATSKPYAIQPTPWIGWAKAIGAGVASCFEFKKGSQERADLESEAVAALDSACRRYDPERAEKNAKKNCKLHGVTQCEECKFKGFAHQAIQQECRREAQRLRNGGTFCTRRDGHAPVVVGRFEEGEGEE